MTREQDMARAVELAEIQDDYEALVKEHTPSSPEAVGWSSLAVQMTYNRMLLQHYQNRPLGDVLEVGCGRGALLQLPGYCNTYTGIDFIQAHIDYCNTKYGKLGNMKFICAEATEWLEHCTNKYDTVLASGVLARYSNHVIRDLLARMFYVTKPDGVMSFNWNKLTCGLYKRDLLIILADIGVERYILRHDYDPRDYTVHCYK